MRTFEKDNGKDGSFSPIVSMENNYPGENDIENTADFTMPDLSTVRKTSDAFNLRLSLDGPKARQALQETSNTPHDIDSSFEVATKGGSPHPNASDASFEVAIRAGSPDHASPLSSSLRRDTDKQPLNRRDSVAGLFTESALFCGGMESDSDEDDEKHGGNNTDADAAEGSVANIIDDQRSTVTAVINAVSSKEDYRRRDSVANFFNGSDVDEEDNDVIMDEEDATTASSVFFPSPTPATRGKPRDSVAPFFVSESVDGDDDEKEDVSVVLDVKNVDDGGNKREMRPRDSIAPFFMGESDVENSFASSGMEGEEMDVVDEKKSMEISEDSIAMDITRNIGDILSKSDVNSISPSAITSPSSLTPTRRSSRRSSRGSATQDSPTATVPGSVTKRTPTKKPVLSPEVSGSKRGTPAAIARLQYAPKVSSPLVPVNVEGSGRVTRSRAGTPAKMASPAASVKASPRRGTPVKAIVKNNSSVDANKSVTAVSVTTSVTTSAAVSPAPPPSSAKASSTAPHLRRYSLASRPATTTATPSKTPITPSKRDVYLLTPRMQAFLAPRPRTDIGPAVLDETARKVLLAGAGVGSEDIDSFAVNVASPGHEAVVGLLATSCDLVSEENTQRESLQDVSVLSKSQMVSDFTLKAGDLTLMSDDSDNKKEELLTDSGDNLMDEELSVMEASFSQDAAVQEEEDPNVITLNDFLQATGLHFIDGLTTSLRRETNAFSRGSDAPSMLEYLNAACLHMPELYSYEHACKAITEHIEEGRQSLRELEADITSNTPPLFYSYVDASEQEQDDLRQLLKTAKSYSRSKTKETWYSWREEIFLPFRQAILQNIESCRKDVRRITGFTAELTPLIEAGQKRLEELTMEVERVKERHDALSSVDPSIRAGMKNKINEQSALLEEMPAAADEAESKADEMKALVANALEKKVAMEEEFSRLEQEWKVIQRRQQGDGKGVAETYRLLIMTHPWQASKQSLDETVALAWTDSAVVVADMKSGNVKADLSLPVTVQNKYHKEEIKLVEIKHIFTLEQMPQALSFSTRQVNRLRGLLADIADARSEFPIETLLGADPHTLLSRATLFNRTTRTHAIVTFEFDLSQPLLYPFGKLSCQVKKTFGEVSEDELLAIAAVSPRGYGRFSKMFQSFKSLISGP